MHKKMDRFYDNLESVFTPSLLEHMPQETLQTLIKLYAVEDMLPSTVITLTLEALHIENQTIQISFADLQLRVRKLAPMKIVPTPEQVA